MVKSFKEIGKKAEELIEQGREADQNIQRCLASVAMANSAIASARRDLEAASVTDEEGNPKGDVEQARARLVVAQNQLAHSQQRLSAARSEANRVRQEKNAHVQEIERHNQTERSNIQKLRQLRTNAFSKDSAAFMEGLEQRLNEAEDKRVELLRSMGIDATAEHAFIGDEVSTDFGWSGGGFADLDLFGVLESIHGKGAEGTNLNNGVATPAGGALITSGYGNEDSSENVTTPDGQSQGIDHSVMLGNITEHPEAAAYDELYGEGSYSSVNIERLVAEQMEDANIGNETHWNGRPRTPNEILADMKRSIRENWMNNFNANEWKRILPEKMYKERLELYRKGIAAVIGNDMANTLSTEDLEQLSRVQNHAYLAGCQLNGMELSELYRSAVDHRGNFVTRQIEYKMDKMLQERAHGLLHMDKYKQSTWQGISVTERKGVLKNLLIDMNSVLGTNVSTDIDFFYEQSGSRGAYSSSSNSVRINEYILAKDSSYQLTQTIIHEMRHAYQHYSVTNEKSVLVSTQTIRAWEDNFNNYKSPSSGSTFEEYLSQPVEWDAKNFAKQYTDIMGTNPEYEGSWS